MGPIISIKTKFLSNNFFSAFLEFQHEASAALLIMVPISRDRCLREHGCRTEVWGCSMAVPNFVLIS